MLANVLALAFKMTVSSYQSLFIIKFTSRTEVINGSIVFINEYELDSIKGIGLFFC